MDPLNILIMVLVMLGLLLLAGWFAGSETALTNISPGVLARLEKEKRKNSRHLMLVKKDMDRSLVTILVLNNIVNIVLSSIAALFANALFDAVGVSLMVGLITFLIIVLGEIVPKSNAMIETERTSLSHARALYYMTRALSPLMSLLVGISNLVLRIRGKRPRKEGVLVSDQDIKDLVALGEDEGTIKTMERDFIYKVFDFGDSKVADAMVPMGNVFMMDEDLNIDKAKRLICSKGYTRVPFADRDGMIKGLVYSKDLLGKSKGRISRYARDIFLLPSDMDLTKAFGEMKRKRIHLAVVTDGKGKQIGIITLEDMIEEIMGEIYDEYFLEKGLMDPMVKVSNRNKGPSIS